MLMLLIVAATIVWALVATVVRIAADGYGRIPTRTAREADGPRYRRIW